MRNFLFLSRTKMVESRYRTPTKQTKSPSKEPSTGDESLSNKRLMLSRAISTFAINFAFGFLLQKGEVYIPLVIQEQFTLQDFTMLKMFLSAVATSQLSMTVLSLLPDLKQRFQTVQQRYATGHQSARGTTITIIGASILGFGMALCGSCPGTIYAQLGTGISTAYYVLAGSLAGSVVYANLQPALQALCRLNRSRAKTLDESLGARYMWPALALAFVELLVVFGLYVLFPNSTSLKDVLDLTSFTWPAYASGIGIGLLQIPSVLLLEQPLGASGNLNSVLAVLNRVPVLKRLIPSKSDLGKTMPLSKHNLLRWLAVVAAVGGAFASASLSRSYDAIAGLESGLVISRNPSRINAQAFVGGLALMVGARIAGGCTSGHGISGFSLLVMNSFAAVPSMFGSAVITAHILKLLSA